MPLIEECPFFGINYNHLEEPFSETPYDVESCADNLEQCLSPSRGGYNGGTIGQHLQDCMDLAATAKESLSQYGSSGGCTINTNFDEIKKVQFHSFVAFLRNKFERYKNLCNYQIQDRYNQSCKKIELKFEFSFINNTFEFTVNTITDLEEGFTDSEKIEEEFDVATFSGQIYYKFYVKPEVTATLELSDEFKDKLNYIFDKTHEILDKTEEE